MTRPLPAISDPIEGRMGRAKPSRSSVRHSVFFSHRSKRHCPQGQPDKNWTVISCIDRLDFSSSLPPEKPRDIAFIPSTGRGTCMGADVFL